MKQIFHIGIRIGITLIFLAVFFLGVFFIGEMVYRIRYLGMKKALLSLTTKNVQTTALGTHSWVVPDPDLNYRLNPNVLGVNSLSMKEKELAIPKPEGLKRILILGDSIPYVGNPTFVDILKARYVTRTDIEFINASTPGYTTYQELEFLKKIAITTEPDIVILTYCLNDNYTFLHYFDEQSTMLMTTEAEESVKIKNSWDAFVSKSYFLSTLKMQYIQQQQEKQSTSQFPWEDEVDFNNAWKEYTWTDFGNRLREMNKLLTEHNAKLYVVIFPLEMQFDDSLLKLYPGYVRMPQTKVSEYSTQYGIPYIDLFEPFYMYQRQGIQLFTDGLHLSREGHIVAADTMYAFLLHDVFFQSRILSH